MTTLTTTTQPNKTTSAIRGTKDSLPLNVRTQVLSEPNKKGRTPTLRVIKRGIELATPTNAVVKALEVAVDRVNRYDGFDSVALVIKGLDTDDAAEALKGLKALAKLGKVAKVTEVEPKAEEPKAEKPKRQRRKASTTKAKTEAEKITAPKEPSAKELVLMALKATQDANVALTTALTAYLDAN